MRNRQRRYGLQTLWIKWLGRILGQFLPFILEITMRTGLTLHLPVFEQESILDIIVDLYEL